MTKSDSIKIEEDEYDGEMHDPILFPARKRAKVVRVLLCYPCI